MSINFKGITKKVPFSKIDLKEYLEFYKKDICNFTFKYILEDETEIIIDFRERNFGHLVGLHKFKRIKSYKKSKEMNDDILKGKITFSSLYSANTDFVDRNKELKDRLTYFPTLKTLLENVDTVLKYDLNVIWNSKIEFSFLLKTNKISILVYLAVKEIKNNKKICVPVSLLVDRNDRFSKMNLKKLSITQKIIESRKQ
ncbi:MAG: PBECR4 domain-containing protein [Fusobacterium sp.]